MCCCEKPNVNGTPNAYSWDGNSRMTRQPSPPDLQDGDEIIWDEPGRCGGLDCHSHHFRLVKRYSSYSILVRHGGGDERASLGSTFRLLLSTCETLDSDARFWLLHSLYSVQQDGRESATKEVSHAWRTAAAEGRVKTRKQPRRNMVKVWIEPRQSTLEALAAP